MANMYFVLFGYSVFAFLVFRDIFLIMLFHQTLSRKLVCYSEISKLLNVGLSLCPLPSINEFSCLDTKLPPRAAFTAQITGTLLGAILNFSASLAVSVRLTTDF